IAIDIDSYDYLTRNAHNVGYRVMKTLAVEGRGIVLLHDIHPSTALAVPALLAQLNAKGFNAVHLNPATPVRKPVAYAISAARREVVGAGMWGVKSVPGQRRRRQALQTESESGATSSSWTWPSWQWPPW